MGRTTGITGALLLFGALWAGDAAAQVSFGGQFSVANLGTETVRVGETLGVGGRFGVAVFENEKTTVMVERVGEAMFPPCDEISCAPKRSRASW